MQEKGGIEPKVTVWLMAELLQQNRCNETLK